METALNLLNIYINPPYKLLIDKTARKGIYSISSFYLNKPVLSHLISKNEEVEAIDESLPESVSSWLMSAPQMILYSLGSLTTLRLYMFNLDAFETWDGPVSSIAEARRHLQRIIQVNADEASKEKVNLYVDRCINHILGYFQCASTHRCGCGHLHAVKKRCGTCGAYMCSTCSSAKYCEGCYSLLLETASDYEGSEE